MSLNIFQIETELQDIINTLEENGGELTEELENRLALTEENFKQKIDSYCSVISMYKSNDTCCKEEKNRINAIQKTRNNASDRLKTILLDAVLKFGNTGKSGNSIIETATHKLYTKNTESFDVDDIRAELLKQLFLEYMTKVYEEGVLVVSDKTAIEITLDIINKMYKIDYEASVDVNGNTPVKEWIPFTVSDLKCLYSEFTFNCNLYDLFIEYPQLAIAVLNNGALLNVSIDVDKKSAIAINKGELGNETPICTLGEVVNKTSLIIK